MNRKFLVHRTVAPQISKLLNDLYDHLKTVNPDVDDFIIMIHDDGPEIQTRIMPMRGADMVELFHKSSDMVKYIAHTDENNNFVSGEEK